MLIGPDRSIASLRQVSFLDSSQHRMEFEAFCRSLGAQKHSKTAKLATCGERPAGAACLVARPAGAALDYQRQHARTSAGGADS